jgi:hypothetical protein
MAFLRPARCPVCGGKLPFVRLWWHARTARGFVLTEKTGLRCPTCTQQLVGLQARVVLSGLVIPAMGVIAIAWVSNRVSAWLGRPFTTGGFLFAIVLPLLLTAIAHFRISPLFARVRLIQHGETVHFPRLTCQNVAQRGRNLDA